MATNNSLLMGSSRGLRKTPVLLWIVLLILIAISLFSILIVLATSGVEIRTIGYGSVISIGAALLLVSMFVTRLRLTGREVIVIVICVLVSLGLSLLVSTAISCTGAYICGFEQGTPYTWLAHHISIPLASGNKSDAYIQQHPGEMLAELRTPQLVVDCLFYGYIWLPVVMLVSWGRKTFSRA